MVTPRALLTYVDLFTFARRNLAGVEFGIVGTLEVRVGDEIEDTNRPIANAHVVVVGDSAEVRFKAVTSVGYGGRDVIFLDGVEVGLGVSAGATIGGAVLAVDADDGNRAK